MEKKRPRELKDSIVNRIKKNYTTAPDDGTLVALIATVLADECKRTAKIIDYSRFQAEEDGKDFGEWADELEQSFKDREIAFRGVQ